jgi:hypothetical protein
VQARCRPAAPRLPESRPTPRHCCGHAATGIAGGLAFARERDYGLKPQILASGMGHTQMSKWRIETNG